MHGLSVCDLQQQNGEKTFDEWSDELSCVCFEIVKNCVPQHTPLSAVLLWVNLGPQILRGKF